MPHADPVRRREYLRQYINNYRDVRRAEARTALGGVCAVCRTNIDLEFDHIDPATKTMAIAKMWTASEAKFRAELIKCQLLCQEHHLEKTKAEGSLKTSQPQPWKHGTTNTYSKYRCRCGLCKEAKRRSRVGPVLRETKAL